jgi:hypothetical protein
MPLPSTKSLLRRRAALLLLAVALLAVTIAVAGCGGDDENGNDEDASALIDKAFTKSIKSADVKLQAELNFEMSGQGRQAITLSATGPFVNNGNKLPKLDMDIKLGSKGQGQALQAGLLSTGDRLFVKFGGEFYEQPKANVDAANRDLANQRKGGKSLFDPGKWVTGATMEGDEKVAGVETEHVSARVDVRRMLGDLNDVARRGANAVGGQAAPQPLTKQQIDEAVKALKDPTFDIYVGKDDQTIRRISGNLQVAVPDSGQSQANGITGGSLQFTLELGKVGQGQDVEAPSRSRPISELSRQLGGAAALGQLGGAGGQSGSGGTSTTPDTTTTPGAGGADDPDAIRRYIACINQTSPGDDAARERCRAALQR